MCDLPYYDLGTPAKTIELGRTQLSEDTFREKLEEMAPEWKASSYNLFKHNCNNFTNKVAKLLLGKGIPTELVKQS